MTLHILGRTTHGGPEAAVRGLNTGQIGLALFFRFIKGFGLFGWRRRWRRSFSGRRLRGLLRTQLVDQTALHKTRGVLLHDLLRLGVVGLALGEDVVETSRVDWREGLVDLDRFVSMYHNLMR